MQQKHHYNSHIDWIVTLLGAAMLLLFFLLFYPYHLRHREQTMLFLLNIDWIRATYLSLEHGGLVRLVGDFVQQFFYYIGAGPVILSILVTLLGVVWYRIVMRIRTLFRLRGGGHEPREEAADVRDGRAGLWKFGAYAFAILVVLWEAGRECLPQYPLASTLQVLGWSTILLLALRCKDRPMAAWTLGIGIIAGCWLLDYEMLPGAKLFGKPNMTVEHLMGLDVEASFGHWTKVEHLTEDDTPNTVDIFYRNLSLAYQNRLPEAMMTRRQNGEEGLFIPVNENGNYFFFGAAGEAWWAVSDMTMAEHATLLAQIFSPRKMGSRYMKRLAEINLDIEIYSDLLIDLLVPHLNLEKAFYERFINQINAMTGHSSVYDHKADALINDWLKTDVKKIKRGAFAELDALRDEHFTKQKLYTMIVTLIGAWQDKYARL